MITFFWKGTAGEYLATFHHPSLFSTTTCKVCEGDGFYYQANGPEDYDKEPCDICGGSGRVLQ
jgi:hypothetical protein